MNLNFGNKTEINTVKINLDLKSKVEFLIPNFTTAVIFYLQPSILFNELFEPLYLRRITKQKTKKN